MERIVAEALHREHERRWPGLAARGAFEGYPRHAKDDVEHARRLLADLREAGWTLVPVRPGAAKEEEWP